MAIALFWIFPITTISTDSQAAKDGELVVASDPLQFILKFDNITTRRELDELEQAER